MEITILGEQGGLYASLASAGHRKIGTSTALLDGARRGLVQLATGTIAYVDSIENRNTEGAPMVLHLTPLTVFLWPEL